MEVVVSAAVLLLVVLGVMAGLDAVAGTAGANKARTVAASLAEKDQEELRSLMTVDLNRIRSVIPVRARSRSTASPTRSSPTPSS